MAGSSVKFVVNGLARSVSRRPDRSLLVVLREELTLTGAKYGCGEGVCGACTVLVNGESTRSCVVPVASAAGTSVTTIEGLRAGEALHPIQQAFLDAGALQCGYCTPGMVVAVRAALEAGKSNP